MKNKFKYILITEICCFVFFLLISCKPDKPNHQSDEVSSSEQALPERGPSKEILVIDQPFIRRYQGLIDRNLIIMVLVNWGDGRLSGWLKYGEDGERKSLDGEINLDESFVLEIFDDMDFQGKVIGSISNIEDLKGEFSNADSSSVVPFSAALMPLQKDPVGWRGVWHLNDTWDGGTLLIGDVQRGTFYMALDVSRNGHVGYFESELSYNNVLAKFNNDIYASGENCLLTIGKQTHRIQIYQKSSSSSCGFGARATATGNYDRELKEVPAQLTYGDSRSHFPSKKNHDDFYEVAGKDHYKSFSFNMQKFIRENKATLSADKEVHSVKGWVAGLMTINESIILYDDEGLFWAANLDPQMDGSNSVQYFTNDPNMKDKLPIAIEEWRSRFPTYPIKKMSTN